MRNVKILLISIFSLLPVVATADPIIETFEGFSSGDVITDQITGLIVSAANDGEARIASASAPVIPGQPLGLYNDAPGIAASGFEFALIFDFIMTGTSIGALIDFGGVGSGLQLTAYDGANGTGNVLGSVTTLTESFLGISADGIKSAVFSQAGSSPGSLPATWLIDNLSYDLTNTTVSVPEPGTLALLGLGLAGLGAARRRKV